jgi:hypothetical protein
MQHSPCPRAAPQDIVRNWRAYPLSKQHEIFDAAVVPCSEAAWDKLEQALRWSL